MEEECVLGFPLWGSTEGDPRRSDMPNIEEHASHAPGDSCMIIVSLDGIIV